MKVRALTRVATPETEERLLAVGRAGTADHVERIVRGWRRAETIEETAEHVTHLGGTGIAAAVDHLDPDQVNTLAQQIQTNKSSTAGSRAQLTHERQPLEAPLQGFVP